MEFNCPECSNKITIDKKTLDKKDSQLITCSSCGSRYFLQFIPTITWQFPPYNNSNISNTIKE